MKSGAGPVMSWKDIIRMGSPLRHVTQLASSISLNFSISEAF